MVETKVKPGNPLKAGFGIASYPHWALRFWHGMLLGDWIRLLARNGFRIHPWRIGLACTVTYLAAINSMLHLVQEIVYGRRIEEIEIKDPPLFILGHWRSGTTWMHELLACDPRFAFPSTYECFAPNHFLLTGGFLPRLLGILLPKKRISDSMPAGFECPQEDEFALVNMGCPSPYLHMAFPNEPPCHMELLDMEGVPEVELLQWKRDLTRFMKAMTLQKQKPLVLKSPPHTGRIGLLAEMFPGSRFIHLTREPCSLFASTRRLWVVLHAAQGLQLPDNGGLKEHVLSCLERMYRGFENQRRAIDPMRICDLRYEDLVLDPVRQMERIYDRLGLGDFEPVRGKMQTYLENRRHYRAHPYEQPDAQTHAEIHRRWSGYAEKYGYA